MPISRCLLATLFATAAAAQQGEKRPPPLPKPDELIARFARLDAERAGAVVRSIERHLQRLDDDLLQSVMSMERGMRSYPARSERRWLLPADYAPTAAPRHLIAAVAPEHRARTSRMHPLRFLPDLEAEVVYDWQLGKAAATGRLLDDTRRFANYAHGYAPGSDHAVARLLEKLDRSPQQRELARYFEHLYADRDGGVYEGVTLFDAWRSGQVVEMPDTDAIAFARNVLRTRSFVSPLPSDRRRERLYRKIREAFRHHLEYRSLRLAAAASFVAAEPEFESTYQPLVRRCHWLWAQVGGDPRRFVARLETADDREEFLLELDDAIRSSPEVIDGRKQALASIAEYIRALADRELRTAGG